MAHAEMCVLCSAIIPEGRQVCPICDARVLGGIKPSGFMSAADVEMLSGLRGNQIKQLFLEYGTQMGGRTWISTRLFNTLDVNGKLQAFKAYPMYAPRIRCTAVKGEKAKRVLKWRYGNDATL